MAIGRKGSRRIVVDGTTYRWRLRRRPTYDQALCDRPCTYAVQHADNPGTILVVITNQPHASNWFERRAQQCCPVMSTPPSLRPSAWAGPQRAQVHHST